MNAIKAHSGHGHHNHANSISFRGGAGVSNNRESIRPATGIGMASDVVYPPGTNHKMGKKRYC